MIGTSPPVMQRQNRHKDVPAKNAQIVRELVDEITNFTPYELRALEMLRISEDTKALRFLKKRIGPHHRAMVKKEKLQDIIISQRTAHK